MNPEYKSLKREPELFRARQGSGQWLVLPPEFDTVAEYGRLNHKTEVLKTYLELPNNLT